ncbi:MAG TPA: hypothetical protein VN317_09780 [Candidatus Methanoperedens sp.]|nr:hypothetical protein [Candidatus Methanoperedens sp.]
MSALRVVTPTRTKPLPSRTRIAFPFVHGHAAAFPAITAEAVGHLPAEVSPVILLDAPEH